MTDDTRAARAAFEAWAKSENWQLRFDLATGPGSSEVGKIYEFSDTDDFFYVWLAASCSIPVAAALLREAGWTVKKPDPNPRKGHERFGT